jgi:glycosyltransferase involved in cell wall biosynthesis
MRNGQPWPRVSVVTPSYNQGMYIECVIRSVLLQGYPDLEYVLIDGGSTDNSVEVIRNYEPWLSYWTSEKDSGQADALRKGFQKTRGDLLCWINSDDLLAPAALSAVAEAYASNPQLGLYAGTVENFGESERSRKVVKQLDISFMNLLLPLYETRPTWHQPGIFFSSELYRKSGGINPRYFYRMDYDLILRMLDKGAGVCYINQTLAYFRKHRLSKTGNLTYAFVKDQMEETYQVAKSFLNKLSDADRERLRLQHVSNLVHTAYFGLVHGHLGDATTCLHLAVKIGGASFYRILLNVIKRGLLVRFHRIM